VKQGLFMTIVAAVALGIAIVVYNFLPEYIKKAGRWSRSSSCSRSCR